MSQIQEKINKLIENRETARLGGGQKADALPRRLHPQDAHHGSGAALPALGGAGAAGQAGGQQEQD